MQKTQLTGIFCLVRNSMDAPYWLIKHGTLSRRNLGRNFRSCILQSLRRCQSPVTLYMANKTRLQKSVSCDVCITETVTVWSQQPFHSYCPRSVADWQRHPRGCQEREGVGTGVREIRPINSGTTNDYGRRTCTSQLVIWTLHGSGPNRTGRHDTA